MNVSDLMNAPVATCQPGDSLALAAGKMWDQDIGCLPVLDEHGRVVGMLTDRDICMAGYTQGRPLHSLPVSLAMSKEVYACEGEDTLAEAEETMRAQRVHRLPVLAPNGKLIGLISLNDLAREAERESGRKGRELSGQEVSATLAAISEPRQQHASAATLA